VLLLVGAVGISLAGAGETRTYAPLAVTGSLTADERAYVDYVSPRLQELVDEMTAVTTLVNERSRNIISLNSHGNKIALISKEITEWGNEHGVPARFAEIDAQIRTGSKIATGTMDRARKALLTLNFSSIPELIPQFDEGRAELTAALAAMKSSTSVDSANEVGLPITIDRYAVTGKKTI
jgi:hypothetical protein